MACIAVTIYMYWRSYIRCIGDCGAMSGVRKSSNAVNMEILTLWGSEMYVCIQSILLTLQHNYSRDLGQTCIIWPSAKLAPFSSQAISLRICSRTWGSTFCSFKSLVREMHYPSLCWKSYVLDMFWFCVWVNMEYVNYVQPFVVVTYFSTAFCC